MKKRKPKNKLARVNAGAFVALLTKKPDWLIITSTYLLASIILFSYYWFFVPNKLEIVYQNWDGPVHTAIAQSLYIPDAIDKIPYASFLQKADYLTTVFPLYPLVIRLFSVIGYFPATILVSNVAGLLAIICFYEFIKKNNLSKNPLILSIVFIFLSPRWFISTHTGSSNPLFVLFVILTFYFLSQKKLLVSGILLMLATLTRSQGIIFSAGIVLFVAFKEISQKSSISQKTLSFVKKSWPFYLSLISIFGTFTYFHFVLGDFWALFAGLKQWPFMASFPFQVFTVYPDRLIQTFWLENHYWIYFSNTLMILMLINAKKYWLAIPAAIYAIPLLFMVNMDLGHYNVPLIPFQLIAFERFLGTRIFLTTLLILLPAQYLYTINFMLWSR